MGKLRNFVTPLHNLTNRDYAERMFNEKAANMDVARKFQKEFFDGDRKYGYGGYKYIIDRWKPVAENFIKTYNLNNNSKVLDVGCGKGFLLYELKKILPKINVFGFDISKYSIENSIEDIKDNLIVSDAGSDFPYGDKEFDFVFSIATLHNLKIMNLGKSLKEVSRVGKQSFIMVESYRNNKELFNLQCWALTCNAFFSVEEWEWIFSENKYSGDYEFMFFE